MTQRELILIVLRDHPEGVCIEDVGRVDPYAVLTARNRISELRADGFDIRSQRCRVHAHRSTVSRYFLVVPAEQMEMEVVT